MTQQTIEIIEAGLSAASRESTGFLESGAGPADVATMVARLDGREYDQLYLQLAHEGESFEAVMQGGIDSTAMFFVIQESETYYVRIHPERLDVEEDAQTTITSGGSRIDVLVRWLVPIDMAARALWFLLLTGERDPGLGWEALSEVRVPGR